MRFSILLMSVQMKIIKFATLSLLSLKIRPWMLTLWAFSSHSSRKLMEKLTCPKATMPVLPGPSLVVDARVAQDPVGQVRRPLLGDQSDLVPAHRHPAVG